jgi:adenylate cyclase
MRAQTRLKETVEIQRLIRYALSLALTVVFLLHVGGVVTIPMLKSLENQAYDARLKLTLPNVPNKQVVIIDIDEKSLGEIGRWPWNRDVMANIIDNLFDYYQINSLGFDIVFAEADQDEGAKLLQQMADGPLKHDNAFLQQYQPAIKSLQRDERFAESLKNRKTIMGFVLDTDTHKGTLPAAVARLDDSIRGRIPFIQPKGYTANLQVLQQNAAGAGFFDNPLLDEDGVFRRVPLLQEYDGELYESLALSLTRAAMGSPRIELVVESDASNKSEMFLEWVKIGDMMIPVDEHAGVLVPYIGPKKSFDYIPAVDILNKTTRAEDIKGKIALFGTSAAGLQDLRTTPLEPAYPGVEIHANIIQGILDQRIMHQPGYTQGFEFLLLAVVGLVLTFLLPVLSPLWGLIASTSMLMLVIVTNLAAWQSYQLVLPLASPLLLIVLIFTLQMTYGFFVETRGKRQLTHLFGQYLSPELVEEMSRNMDEITLDGEIREMTVLFSDVRNFTTISESMEPKELTQLINGFLTPITHIIFEQRGTIDKYMGDAVMAFWGAPSADPQHALHALNAAMQIVNRMRELRTDFAARGWPEIRIGIGINTGEMNVGNKGSEFRVDYTILGDAVNLGSRLEGLTKVYGVDIIAGENTRYAVPEYEYRELDLVRVKGKDKPVAIYEPLGLLENVDKSVRKDLKRFHLGLSHYRARHWDEAEREIFALSQNDPDRRIYQIYLDRIIHFRKEPPPDDWDGSFTHTSK